MRFAELDAFVDGVLNGGPLEQKLQAMMVGWLVGWVVVGGWVVGWSCSGSWLLHDDSWVLNEQHYRS